MHEFTEHEPELYQFVSSYAIFRFHSNELPNIHEL